jgi:hypothetical protein
MATFYVLPPRECLEQAAADFLARVLPGVAAPPTLWESILDTALVPARDLYVVHREDLPGEGDLADDLTSGFGAEPGDAVIEVGLAVGAAPARVRRWTVPATVSEPAAGR